MVKTVKNISEEHTYTQHIKIVYEKKKKNPPAILKTEKKTKINQRNLLQIIKRVRTRSDCLETKRLLFN